MEDDWDTESTESHSENTFYGSGGDHYDGISISVTENTGDTDINIGPYNNVTQFAEVQNWRASLREDEWTSRDNLEAWRDNIIASILGLLGDEFLNWLNSWLTDTRAKILSIGYGLIWTLGMLYAFFTYLLPNLFEFSELMFGTPRSLLLFALVVIILVGLSAGPNYILMNYQDLYAKHKCEICGPFKYRRKARRTTGDNIHFSDYVCTESEEHGYTVDGY